MALQKIKYDTKRKMYCGPTAICAVTGVSASVTLRTIEQRRGSGAFNEAGRLKGVRGMWNGEVVATLRLLGFGCMYRDVEGRPTVAAHTKAMRSKAPGQYSYDRILHVGHHYVAVSTTQFCDTKTKQPVKLKDAPLRRARVKGEILVWKL